jgi:hypothetical protein
MHGWGTTSGHRGVTKCLAKAWHRFGIRRGGSTPLHVHQFRVQNTRRPTGQRIDIADVPDAPVSFHVPPGSNKRTMAREAAKAIRH